MNSGPEKLQPDAKAEPDAAGERPDLTRRDFLRSCLRGSAVLGVGGVIGLASAHSGSSGSLWQIDPYKCTACGRCAEACILTPSAVKCVHAFMMCGYCKLCTGFFDNQPHKLNSGAENQLCPTGAIVRTFVEDPYYEYKIDEPLCIGCGACVKGCSAFGNGSLFLQIRHDRCVNCNQCRIVDRCPAQAVRRIPASQAYIVKGKGPKP